MATIKYINIRKGDKIPYLGGMVKGLDAFTINPHQFEHLENVRFSPDDFLIPRPGEVQVPGWLGAEGIAVTANVVGPIDGIWEAGDVGAPPATLLGTATGGGEG